MNICFFFKFELCFKIQPFWLNGSITTNWEIYFRLTPLGKLQKISDSSASPAWGNMNMSAFQFWALPQNARFLAEWQFYRQLWDLPWCNLMESSDLENKWYFVSFSPGKHEYLFLFQIWAHTQYQPFWLNGTFTHKLGDILWANSSGKGQIQKISGSSASPARENMNISLLFKSELCLKMRGFWLNGNFTLNCGKMPQLFRELFREWLDPEKKWFFSFPSLEKHEHLSVFQIWALSQNLRFLAEWEF